MVGLLAWGEGISRSRRAAAADPSVDAVRRRREGTGAARVLLGMNPMSSTTSRTTDTPVAIRPAGPSDATVLRRLAALDSRRPLRGRVLIAEREGSPLAALGLDDGRAVADPFVLTDDLVALLRLRAGL
jgi:hypothetical protein